MVSAKLNQNGDNIENISAEQFLSKDSSNARGAELLPRVGDEYQAEIPVLTSGPHYDSYLKRPVDAKKKNHVPLDFWLGLSVPVTWTNNINKVNENVRDAKQGFSTESINAPSILGSVREKIDPYQRSSYSFVPGVCGQSWNDIEVKGFLLGLYSFEKKFVELKRFVGSKKMGDVLLFYYSKFYRSPEYNKWSTCRKGRTRKCVSGQLLFSGLWRQELLSRLLSQVSEECQKALIEVNKIYAKNDMSLIEYVFAIKSMVGQETFADVVAIGKGKQDLTSMIIAPVRIPNREACSHLTCTEIVNFLTGGYRLSKAQSRDLFWEAVWPRLLARGWHSEQPKNQAYVPGAKDFPVFLTPGVEKFSRELVQGNHYFDSVTAVLDKVGSEPELLELHTENDEGKKEKEDGWIEEIEQENSNKKRQCYLQDQTPICNMDDMKFAIGDTTLDNGKFSEFRELRILPTDISKMKIVPKDSDHGTSNASTNKSDCALNMLVAQETDSTTHVKITSNNNEIFNSSSDQLGHTNGPDSIKPVEIIKQKKFYDDQQAMKPVDIHMRQKLKRNDPDTLASVTKRYKTEAACCNEEIGSRRSTIPLVLEFGDHVHVCCSNIYDPNNKAFTQQGLSKDRMASTSSRKESSCWSTGGSQDENGRVQENPQSSMSIDLNLPQQPANFPSSISPTNLTSIQDDIKTTQQENSCAPKTSADIRVPEQPARVNSRRQSTRNRIPTARALEALVNGDLTARSRITPKDQ